MNQQLDPQTGLRILAIRDLREVRRTILQQAEQHRELMLKSWNSLAKANRMEQIAAEAQTVTDLRQMVETQSKRWGANSDDLATKDLSEKMLQFFDNILPEKLSQALTNTVKEGAKRYKESASLDEFQFDADWRQEQLLHFSRLYIHTLVAHRQIAEGNLCRGPEASVDVSPKPVSA